MTFQFRWLCELLDELNSNRHKQILTTARTQNYDHQILYGWYQRFSHKIDRTGYSAVAFLSCLLPERRADRVYNLQAKRLSQIFGRALGLGSARALELNRWREQAGADFATCVERTLQQCENVDPLPGREVTLEEINDTLDLIAAHSISSSPDVRAKLTDATPAELLSPLLRRLKSNEAKWFIRMVLRNYAPVQVPEYQALHGFHFMLPTLLMIQNSFKAAISVLASEEIRQLPARPDKEYERALQSLVSQHVRPQLGVMIKRQPYHKARSIKHCCNLAAGRQMSIERKYDGEYCQVHIKLSKGYDRVQIFSKSGKDSTMDRIRLHGAIKDALRIGRNGCKIRSQCVVEGELMVWSSSKQQIQPFHKIRKYVKHGGRDIGTARDSPESADEHLMIAFYDILVLDDHMLLNKPHKVRRQYLKTVLQTNGMEGRAILAERIAIDFRSKRASAKLRAFFAKAITQRWEGLVLKGLNEPYFDWKHQLHGIKLKKDYITRLGDIADLCIVGARRDPQAELQMQLGPLRWTSFYIGAVTNMETIRRFDVKPRIKIIDVLTQYSMPNAELLDLNKLGQLVETGYAQDIPEFDVEIDRLTLDPPSHLFKKPFIVEIMGAGFEKLSNSSFYTLRFPRKVDGRVKLHTDRTLLDTVSFSDLQRMAKASMTVPVDGDSQEDAQWIEKLIRADGRNRQTQSASQNTSLAGTIRSPSAVTLSPANLGDKAIFPVFVRPDTEEPETQATDLKNFPSQVTSPTKVRKQDPNSLCASPNSKQYIGNLKKRQFQPSETRTGHDLCRKKPRLHGIEGGKQLETVNSCATDNRAGHRTARNAPNVSKIVTAEPTSITGPLCPKPFDPPAVFQRFQGSSVSFVGSESNKDGSLSTPDSTLVMRQILNAYSGNDTLPATFSPTKMATGRLGSLALISNQKGPDQLTNVPHLPTPPTSSPIMTNNLNKQLNHTTSTMALPVEHLLSHQPMPDLDMASDTHSERKPTPNFPPILLFLPEKKLHSALLNTHASFTLSTVHFLRQIQCVVEHSSKNAQTLTSNDQHIILIDSSDLDLVTNGFSDLAACVEEYIVGKCTHNTVDEALDCFNGKMLVFDYKVLDHLKIKNDTVDCVALRGLDFDSGRGSDAETFCGVVQFFERGELVRLHGRAYPNLGVRLDYNFDWTRQG